MLKIKNLNLTLNTKNVLQDISFEISEGEILSIIGKSGCGKTSLLKCIAGIHKDINGTIILAGQDITHTPINERNTTLVFQEYSLFPHMTLEQNLDIASTDIALQRYVIKNMNLTHLYGKYPHQMSGGEQQRCAMARAIIYKPKLLLFDEPFSNVDAITTKALRTTITGLLHEFGITTIIVTHDLEDVYEMSNRCMIIEDGKLIQMDSLDIIKSKPKTLFIKSLFDSFFTYKGRICKIISKN